MADNKLEYIISVDSKGAIDGIKLVQDELDKSKKKAEGGGIFKDLLNFLKLQ